MKLKQYFDILNERIGFDDIDEPFSDKNQSNDTFDDDDEIDDDEVYYGDDNINFGESDDDVMQHLASTIRNMIQNIKPGEFYVDYENYDISIQFILNKTERFNSIMKIMGILKKLQTDILIQYDADVDLWESKEGEPLLTVNFYYDSNVSGTYNDDDVVF